MDKNLLMKYMLPPVLGPNNVYSTKIIIHSNHTLRSYLVNPNFRDYLSSELIVVENNNLHTVTPTNVGFLEHVVPSHESVHLHTARLQQLLPSDMPKFQVSLVKTHISDRRYIYLVMIQSHSMHVDTFSQHLRDLAEKKYIKYIPWHFYMSRTAGEKYSILQELKTWISLFRSITVTGFRDNTDIVKMQESTTDDMVTTTNTYQTITVSDYL
jgi:metal-responsive CopG/Arc/MetJ family transcriptional regulator